MEYAFITISGTDRHTFLQGQLTQDLDRLAAERTLPAAWCDPQGRVTVTARLFDAGERIVMAVPSSALDATLKRLTLYRLRADVGIDTETAWTARAYADGPGADPDSRADPVTTVRHGSGFVEAFGPADAFDDAEPDALDAASWAVARIAAGLVDIGAENAGKYTPHMLNLDRTGAVSFSKGCYTGQEIVARTENLGRVKRRINRYRTTQPPDGPLRIGDRLTCRDDAVGEIVNASGRELLALVPIDRHGETLAVGGTTAAPLPLPYSLD